MADRQDLNQRVIAAFRANSGVVDELQGWPLILINHVGAKSGRVYTSPVVYTRDGDNYVVIASKGGGPEDPQWFRNLVAHPEVTIEVGTETLPVRARVTAGEERAKLYRAQAKVMPNFNDYAAATTREIPVVALEPA